MRCLPHVKPEEKMQRKRKGEKKEEKKRKNAKTLSWVERVTSEWLLIYLRVIAIAETTSPSVLMSQKRRDKNMCIYLTCVHAAERRRERSVMEARKRSEKRSKNEKRREEKKVKHSRW